MHIYIASLSHWGLSYPGPSPVTSTVKRSIVLYVFLMCTRTPAPEKEL